MIRIFSSAFLTLGVEEPVDVGVVRMQVHSTGALTRTQLVGVGERVLEKLHDRDDTRTLVLDLLDRGAVLTNVGEQQGNSATALGQLQCRVDGATDGLHVVFDTKQEAGHGLTALFLARVQESRGGGLEASGDDLVDEFRRPGLRCLQPG